MELINWENEAKKEFLEKEDGYTKSLDEEEKTDLGFRQAYI